MPYHTGKKKKKGMTKKAKPMKMKGYGKKKKWRNYLLNKKNLLELLSLVIVLQAQILKL